MECRESDKSMQCVVIETTTRYLSEQNINRDAFIKTRVLPLLVEHGILEEPSSAGRFSTWENSQCKKFERLIKGETSIKADLILPWSAALPEPYRSSLLNELCGFFGSYFTPITKITGNVSNQPVKSFITTISREFADVLNNSMAVMDGIIDENDSDESLQQYANEVHELVSAGITELGRVYRSRGILPAAHIAMASSPLFQPNGEDK